MLSRMSLFGEHALWHGLNKYMAPDDVERPHRDNCCGSQELDAGLVIEYPSWVTIIGASRGLRPTLIAPEPTCVILASQ